MSHQAPINATNTSVAQLSRLAHATRLQRRGSVSVGIFFFVPDGEFDFPGYTFGRMYSARTGKAYPEYRPSRKSIKRMVENVHALTVRRRRKGGAYPLSHLYGHFGSYACAGLGTTCRG